MSSRNHLTQLVGGPVTLFQTRNNLDECRNYHFHSQIFIPNENERIEISKKKNGNLFIQASVPRKRFFLNVCSLHIFTKSQIMLWAQLSFTDRNRSQRLDNTIR
ncbi:uncharacterized protein LOC123310170 [Coccinella septempunctata]|uniref:uncharacterized protein LOC123310170 n=1 Tax=Coccinella septempunctata TaxID=41139 RepID=UPI001D0696AE|nr:uncharacterized protein LOC123310170 [Coccinella septempunctata]